MYVYLLIKFKYNVRTCVTIKNVIQNKCYMIEINLNQQTYGIYFHMLLPIPPFWGRTKYNLILF